MLNPKLESALYCVQKPGRYVGGEKNSVIKDKNIDIRFAMCYPDLYEVGMSNLSIKILYELINSRTDAWCERAFAPALDMEEQMRNRHIPLWGLESGDPLSVFDFIGFTLQFELNYTCILQMLELSGIPIYAKDRTEDHPIIVAGGPCAFNSEPVADFFDLIMIGDGEEQVMQVLDLYAQKKKDGLSKSEFLRRAAEIRGVYIPSLYTVTYTSDHQVTISPDKKVRRYVISDLDHSFMPEKPLVPTIQAIHDRVALEMFRGCIRGCRFCQAGMIYRPARFRSVDRLLDVAKKQCANTGYDEMSLLSLSSSDYPDINNLIHSLTEWTCPAHIRLSLPSLRIDNMPKELLEKIGESRKNGLTFAPEAGSQRLRDVINKNITEDDIINTCKLAFEQGYTSIKLYFMLGLPSETDADILAIGELAQKIVNLYYALPTRQKGKSVSVGISLSTFVPKPFTPFQWEPQLSGEEIDRRQKLLRDSITTKKITVRWNDKNISNLEAVFARGDRRLSRVIEKAYTYGARFDGWDEWLRFDAWEKAFAECGMDPVAYGKRAIDLDAVLPWDMIDAGITKQFLQSENQKAHHAVTTPDCMTHCSGCGMAQVKGGVCFE